MQEERKWVFSDQLVVKKVITVFIFPLRKSLWGSFMTVKGFIRSAAAEALTLICLRRLWSFPLSSTKLHFSNSKLTQNVLCDTDTAKQDLRDVTYILWFKHSNLNVAMMCKVYVNNQRTRNNKQRVWWKYMILSLFALRSLTTLSGLSAYKQTDSMLRTHQHEQSSKKGDESLNNVSPEDHVTKGNESATCVSFRIISCINI